MTAVRLEGVVKRYGAPSGSCRVGPRRCRHVEALSALDGLDLEVRSGELLAVVGPSGSGKSTALRVLAGLERPDGGRVLVDGRDVGRVAPHRRGVAMVFQDYALYPHLTVRENLGFGARVRRVPAPEIAARVERVCAALGLVGLEERHPDQLSGGERQRVALGRALVGEPRVLLLDEPMSNLDLPLRHAARAELVALHRRLGMTTVHVTHDQAEAMTVGQRVAVIAGGRLEQVGRPQEVYDRPATRFVAGFLGSPPMNLVGGGGVLGGLRGTTVGVRPEDLHLDPHGTVAATVATVEALGSETILGVETADGTRLAIRTAPRTSARPGDDVRVRVDRGHVFDETTGRRIERIGRQEAAR